VPAGKGWPADFLLTHPLAAVEELVVPATHPEWGEYLRHGPMVRFEKGASYPGPSVAGDSTVALLEELGLGADEIRDLLGAGVVRSA
jgi:crotonobetainyl-CoA:carnitine CoA-transferase CaiB-like acyl-CoA transferase